MGKNTLISPNKKQTQPMLILIELYIYFYADINEAP